MRDDPLPIALLQFGFKAESVLFLSVYLFFKAANVAQWLERRRKDLVILASLV
jgi:hypothetical protein